MTIGDEDDLTVEERLEKLERRAEGWDSTSMEIFPVTRALCDTRIERAREPHLLLSVLVGAVAVAMLLMFGVIGVLHYLVRNPMPFIIQIPPPHSTQLPKEGP